MHAADPRLVRAARRGHRGLRGGSTARRSRCCTAGDAGHDGQPGDPDRGDTTRSPTCSSASTTRSCRARSRRTSSSRTAAPSAGDRARRRCSWTPSDRVTPDRRRRRLPQHRPSPRSRSAACPCPTHSRTSLDPALAGHARRRGPGAPPRPASRSCSPRWRPSARTPRRAGRPSGAPCAPTASQVASGWEEAYYGRFSGGSGRGRPAHRRLVRVEPRGGGRLRRRPRAPRSRRPRAHRRGLLPPGRVRRRAARARASPSCAGAFIDFLLSPETQAELPMAMFVLPGARGRRRCPRRSRGTRSSPAAPLRLDPAVIDANRERWIDEWTDIVLR